MNEPAAEPRPAKPAAPPSETPPSETPSSETPSTGRPLLTGLFAISSCVACVGLAAVGLSLLRIANALEQRPDLATLADTAATSAAGYLIEEGFAASPLDPSEPLLRQRTILITEAINERTARRVVERLLHLNELDRQQPIDLLISTSGGWKDSAFTIIDAIERIDAPVNTRAIGGCYSAGSMLLVAGTGVRTATRNALLSIHVYPTLPESDDYDRLENLRFSDLYLQRSQTPIAVFDVAEESQPYFTADQALEWGLIDAIAEPQTREPRPAAAAPPRNKPADKQPA